MDPISEYTTIAGLACVFLASIVTNLLSIFAFCRRPGFKNVSDRFVLNVLAGDVPMSASAVWVTWETLSGTSEVRLLAAESVACGMAVATLLGVLLVTVDQHRAVTDPLRYMAAPHLRKPTIAALVAWAIALLCAVSRTGVSFVDYDKSVVLFRWVYFGAVMMPPAAAIACMHTRIYSAARCSRASPPGAGAVVKHRGGTSAGRASAASAFVAVLHVPHAFALALDVNPAWRAAAFAALAAAACLAPFPLALRSRRVRRELHRVLKPSRSLRYYPPRNVSVCALRLLSSSDAEKGQRSSASSLVAELTSNLTLPTGSDDARASFSSGTSTQLSAASDD